MGSCRITYGTDCVFHPYRVLEYSEAQKRHCDLFLLVPNPCSCHHTMPPTLVCPGTTFLQTRGVKFINQLTSCKCGASPTLRWIQWSITRLEEEAFKESFFPRGQRGQLHLLVSDSTGGPGKLTFCGLTLIPFYSKLFPTRF